MELPRATNFVSDSFVWRGKLQEQRRKVKIEQLVELRIGLGHGEFELDIVDEPELFGFVGSGGHDEFNF